MQNHLTACNFPTCGYLADGATEEEQVERIESHEWTEHSMIDGRVIVSL